jgi:hypothetical protein
MRGTQSLYRAWFMAVGGTLVLAVTGCGADSSVTLQQPGEGAADNSRQKQATELCETVGQPFASNFGTVDSLARAHPASVRAFIAWEEQPKPGGPQVESLYRGRPPQQFVALCYFDGDFNGSLPGGPPSLGPRSYVRLMVSVTDDGEPRLYAAGPSEALRADDAPADSA